MPPKRKPAIILTLSNKKQKTQESTDTPEARTAFYNKTLDQLNELRDESGENIIVAPFSKLPSKKIYPDYYQIIGSPVSVQEIKSRVKKSQYANVDEFLNDFELLAENANAYNDEESFIAIDSKTIFKFVSEKIQEYKDATTSKPVIEEPKSPAKSKKKSRAAVVKKEAVKNETEDEAEKENDEEESKDPNERSYVPDLIQILKSMISYRVTNRGKLSEPFMELVDAEQYPDYYAIIKEGMSFNLMKERLATDEYYGGGIDGVLKFKTDAKMIFENAKAYNKEGSVIYRDAESLLVHLGRKLLKFKEEHPEIEGESQLVDEDEFRPKGRKPRGPNKPKSEDGSDEVRKPAPPRKRTPARKTVKNAPTTDGGDDDDEDNNNDEDNDEDDDDNDDNDERHGDNGEGGLDEQDGADSEDTSVDEEPQYTRTHLNKSKQLSFIKQFSLASALKQYMQLEASQFFEYIFTSPSLSTGMNAIHLPSVIIGQPLVILVTLLNKIVDEKYLTELKINGEALKASPITITYDVNNTEAGFVASKYEFKLSYGLNLVEFILKVPNVASLFEEENTNIDEENGENNEEVRLRRSRTATSAATGVEEGEEKEKVYVTESVKVWVTITQ